MSPEIAKSVIEQMGAQIDLLVTLATAVFGGLIALFIQILNQKSDLTKANVGFDQRSQRFMLLCLVFESLSICAGYLARSSLTALTPAIFRVNPSALQSWSDAQFPGRFFLGLWPTLQFLLFGAGMLMLFLFMFRNRHLLGGASP
jgi:hypothetical protein